jgi:prepilin-type processing-associated H-X9-DG protein
MNSIYGNGDALVFRHYSDYTESNVLYFDGHVGRVLLSGIVKSYKTLLSYPDPFIHPPN